MAGGKEAQTNTHGKCKSFAMVEYYYIIACAINAVPFRYDRLTRRLTFRQDIKYNLWLWLILGGVGAELALITYELLRALVDETVSRGNWCLILFLFISWMTVFGFELNVYFKKEMISDYSNQMIRIREHFTEVKLAGHCQDQPNVKGINKTKKQKGEKRQSEHSAHVIIQSYIICMMLQCFFQCLMVAAEGTKSHFFYSKVPAEYRNSWTAGIWAVYAYYRVTTNFMEAYFFIFSGMMHVQCVNEILTYRSQIGDTRQSLKIYRMLQILCSRYNGVYSQQWIPQMLIMATGNIILGNYGTLKFYGEMEMAAYMNFPLMGILMVIFCLTCLPQWATIRDRTEFEKNHILWESLNCGKNQTSNLLIRSSQQEVKAQAEKNASPGVGLETKISNSLTHTLSFSGQISQNQPKSCSKNDEGNKESPAAMPLEVSGNPDPFPGENKENCTQGTKETKRFDSRELLCMVRSCPTIAVEMGTFYQVKRSTVLTLFNFIAGNTVSTLLSFP